jgi:DNA-binding LacI/PurR family transcriptional regulator
MTLLNTSNLESVPAHPAALRRPAQAPAEPVAAIREAISRVTEPPRRQVSRPKKPVRQVGLRHRQLALLFPDNRRAAMRTPLSGRFMQSIAETLLPLQLDLIPTLLQEDGELPTCIRKGTVDGVIVRGATDIAAVAPKLRHLPCVWLLALSGPPPHGDQVADNTVAAGQLAAGYFAERGHTHVAVLNHDTPHPCYAPRAASFLQAAAARGLRARGLGSKPMDQLVAEAMALTPRPTGLFLPVPDTFIHEAYRALDAMGVRPVRDVDVLTMSYDPQGLARLDPGLPNLEIEAERIAAAAVETLLWRLKHPDEPRRRLAIAPRLTLPKPAT